jgi:polyisoprenoid-binding protein YceI
MRFLLRLLPLLLLAGSAWSEQVGLWPPGSAVGFRTYGFGLIPLDGKFTRFRGWTRYDPANASACLVMLDIEAGSLEMSDDSIRDRITGPEMMDTARFPGVVFRGTCQGESITGDLTMHGETHPFSLDLTSSAGMVTATGRLRPADWGITGSPLLAGPAVRIRATVPNPVRGSHA